MRRPHEAGNERHARRAAICADHPAQCLSLKPCHLDNFSGSRRPQKEGGSLGSHCTNTAPQRAGHAIPDRRSGCKAALRPGCNNQLRRTRSYGQIYPTEGYDDRFHQFTVRHAGIVPDDRRMRSPLRFTRCGCETGAARAQPLPFSATKCAPPRPARHEVLGPA